MGFNTTSTTADVTQQPRLNRSRWAAIGAAVAVSLGAGGFGLASATVSTGEQPVYIAIDPCRLTDSRSAATNGTNPPEQIGTRTTKYGPAETFTLVGTGAQGKCNVPAGVSALQLNVTALNASQATFLQFAPGTALVPDASSSLNPTPGEPPTPNAVTIAIDDSGQFSIFNKFGTVDVVIDIVGYYDDHEHTGADIVDETIESADIKNNTVTNVDTSNEPGISYNADTADEAITTAEEIVLSTRIRPPSSGYVHVSASVDWFAAADQQIRCSLTDGTATHTTAIFRDSSASSLAQTFSVEATFPVEAWTGLITSGRPFNLVCDMAVGTGNIGNAIMSATFFASSYEPIDFIFPVFPFLEEGTSEGDDA